MDSDAISSSSRCEIQFAEVANISEKMIIGAGDLSAMHFGISESYIRLDSFPIVLPRFHKDRHVFGRLEFKHAYEIDDSKPGIHIVEVINRGAELSRFSDSVAWLRQTQDEESFRVVEQPLSTLARGGDGNKLGVQIVTYGKGDSIVLVPGEEPFALGEE